MMRGDVVVDREYQLIDGARAYAAENYGNARRIVVTSAADYDGDFKVRLLDGSRPGCSLYFKPDQFTEIDETPSTARSIQHDATYTLIPGARAWRNYELHGATRVKVISGPDSDGDYETMLLDGDHPGTRRCFQPSQFQLDPTPAAPLDSVDVDALLRSMST